MLTRLRLENFKSWKDTGEIPMKPITGFFGANSSGKTSLFQALLLMKQNIDFPDRRGLFHFGDERALVDMGDFESVIHGHDTERTLKVSLGWNAKNGIEIPAEYGGGDVAPGDDTKFDLAIRELRSGSDETQILEDMSYRINDGRRFGVREDYNVGRMAYYRPPSGPEFQSKDSSGQTNCFPPGTLHVNPSGRVFFYDLQLERALIQEAWHYLGPLRIYPRRIYASSGTRLPDIGIGTAGEYAVDEMLSSKERREGVLDHLGVPIMIDEYVAIWLRRLGLAHHFRIETLVEGRRIFEVKVRKSPGSAEVPLTDMGFGVSQILPVLVLCFSAPIRSTVILEQPDIHLHPSAQAGLADVFIDAWEKRGVQILFESHSEHLLRRLQRRIAEETIKQDDVGLFFCSMEEDGSSSLSHLELDEYGNIANWPKDFFGDQFGEIAAMSEAALKRKAESD